MVGDRVGPFRLTERLGRGARTEMFKAARDDGSARPPVVAAVRVALDPADEAAADELRLEYETLRHLDDERIRRVYALYAGQAAVAMEWVEGANLTAVRRLAAAGRVVLDPATAADVLVEVATALRHAHERRPPVIHGGLRTGTVLLDPDGRVVVSDWGVDPPAGTFQPPEAWATGLDERSDQWFLGAIAVELLTEAPVYPPDTSVAVQRQGSVDEAVARVARACAPMRAVVARLLAAYPEDRFPSDGDLLRELLAASRQVAGVSRRIQLAAVCARELAAADAPPPPAPLPERVQQVAAARAEGASIEDRPAYTSYSNSQVLVAATFDDEEIAGPLARASLPPSLPDEEGPDAVPEELLPANPLPPKPPPQRRADRNMPEWVPTAAVVVSVALALAAIYWWYFAA
jgi:hypothetical protein